MTLAPLFTASACLLVALTSLLTPMAPGGVIDTRDFGALPRWQFRAFNVFLVSLGLASLVVATLALLAPGDGVLVAAAVVAALYVGVFAADLGAVFPVVEDDLPGALVVLEAISLALAGVLLVVVAQGLLA